MRIINRNILIVLMVFTKKLLVLKYKGRNQNTKYNKKAKLNFILFLFWYSSNKRNIFKSKTNSCLQYKFLPRESIHSHDVV